MPMPRAINRKPERVKKQIWINIRFYLIQEKKIQVTYQLKVPKLPQLRVIFSLGIKLQVSYITTFSICRRKGNSRQKQGEKTRGKKWEGNEQRKVSKTLSFLTDSLLQTQLISEHDFTNTGQHKPLTTGKNKSPRTSAEGQTQYALISTTLIYLNCSVMLVSIRKMRVWASSVQAEGKKDASSHIMCALHSAQHQSFHANSIHSKWIHF